MPSKRSKQRSIASQLVFLFTLAAALLMTGALVILYVIVIRHAFEEDNEVLADRVAAIQADLENSGGPTRLEEELQLQHGGERTVYWIRVLDPRGQTLAETPGMIADLPPNLFPRAQPQKRELSPKTYRNRGKLFSLLTTKEEAGGHPYLLQIAQDRSEDQEFTWNFGWLLAGVLALGIFLSALIAKNVTRRGLKPLADLTRSLERVGPKRLHERMPATGWPRELQPLVTAFDGMLDRLEDSFTRLSQFSADLAHELRTPIANLRGEAEVALTRARTSQEYREVIESSAAEGERLSRMIDNLLFLARAEAAENAVVRETFDGRAEIERVAAYYETITEERGIKIRVEGRGAIYAEPLLFSRALSNLLENAFRFTPDGGEVTIRLLADAEQATVIVQDSGCGLAAEHLPRVFDRFYRADSSRSSQGSGLGLALVKSITNLHGGSASITSELGRGASVMLVFPNRSTEVTLGEGEGTFPNGA